MSTEVTFEDEQPAPPPTNKIREKFHKKREEDASSASTEADGADLEQADDTKTKTSKPDTKAVRELRESEAKDTVEWIKSLQADGSAIKVLIKRREPKHVIDPATNQRVKVDGLLDTIEREISEQEIQQTYGGGTIQLVIQKRNQSGRFEYLTARQFEIAGDPILHNLPRLVAPKQDHAVPSGPAPADPLLGRAFDFMANAATAQRVPTGPSRGEQLAEIKMFMEPLERQLGELREQNRLLMQQLAETKKGDPHETTFQQKMLDKLVDGDSARVTAIRTQFESEIRTIKENAREDEKRLRESFERDKQYMNSQHEREISNLKSSHEVQLASIRQSHELNVKVLETENKRLDRENTKIDAELQKLRDKKEPSLKDKVEEINMFKDLFEDDKEDSGSKSTITKVLEGAAQSPVIAGFAERLMGGGQPQQPPPEAQQAARPSRRVRLLRDRRNGQVYATDGQQAVPVQRREAALPVPAATGEAGTTAPTPAPPQHTPTPIPYIEPETVKTATDYMLQAFQNNTDPETFASSIRLLVPKEVINAMGTLGVRDFLIKIGNLDAASPLMSQAGINWARKVAASLTGSEG